MIKSVSMYELCSGPPTRKASGRSNVVEGRWTRSCIMCKSVAKFHSASLPMRTKIETGEFTATLTSSWCQRHGSFMSKKSSALNSIIPFMRWILQPSICACLCFSGPGPEKPRERSSCTRHWFLEVTSLRLSLLQNEKFTMLTSLTFWSRRPGRSTSRIKPTWTLSLCEIFISAAGFLSPVKLSKIADTPNSQFYFGANGGVPMPKIVTFSDGGFVVIQDQHRLAAAIEHNS